MKNNKQALLLLNALVRDIGSKHNILSKETIDFFNENLEDDEDREVVDSLLLGLQDVNVQLENMSWLNKHYRILHEFAQICSKTLNEETLLKKAHEMVSKVMPTDSFYIALYNEGDTEIEFVLMADKGKFYPRRRAEFGDNYASKVIQTREIIHHKEALVKEEFDSSFGETETTSCLFVPVIIDDSVRGVLSAQSDVNFAYRKEHEELLQIIGTHVINSIETARLYEKIYKMTITDELTGLKNYRAFHEDLSSLIKEGNRDITLIMIDSDNLKRVNDNYGHDIGDLYLSLLADGIKSIMTDQITGYRYAGDEFMVIINGDIKEGVRNLYKRLIEFYSANPINIFNNKINVSISSGVAHYPNNGMTVDTLKKSADEALYEAKEQGKNQLVFS
ncbi:sensor domain-containing diguanylate cyclase [Bacillus sp. 31A1R]|uniref:Sensor domain-containing diguanylate cyclase n=1 Tax=Robertmurraya mangrovi TaxID=3098077 RepID=A0ABU5J411_9BACI|nr:sensor domain-containing diguanylate cyclase [Bacillus sp. 31A1R]MDZ5474082.1 sensor domain-containing diguanylate cyclase [Bacillus sp. 31A1R]